MKKRAKVVKDGGNKWILKIEGMDRAPWLWKDRVDESPLKGEVKVGVEIEVDIKKNQQRQWRINEYYGVVFSAKHSQPNENLYLKLFKKKRLFNHQCKFDESYHLEFQKSQFDEIFVRGVNQNHIQQAKDLLGEGRVDSSLILSPEWRMSLGIGGTSVYETGLTLHHVYGIPYIPATAVKGITSSYAATEVYNNEVEALSKQDYCDIFGCNGEGKVKIGGKNKPFKSYYKQQAEASKNEEDLGSREGKVIFFDAFPQSTIKLEADIMNVHYPDWYGKGMPPGDWQNPNPIPFLTVGEETAFQFVLGVKREEDIPLLAKAKTWLHSALTQHGIGAKTAVGYGFFTKNQ